MRQITYDRSTNPNMLAKSVFDILGTPLRPPVTDIKSIVEKMVEGSASLPAFFHKRAAAQTLNDAYNVLRTEAENWGTKERVLVIAVCDSGGNLPFQALYKATNGLFSVDFNSGKKDVEMKNTISEFKNTQRRLNPKLKKLGWKLERVDNCAVLKNLPANNPATFK